MYMFISAYTLITLFTLLYPLHITLLLHLVSMNHKFTQPCYFPLLYKPAAYKVKMDCNSLMRSSMLCAAPVAIPVVLWSLPLFYFARESSLSLETLFV
jgi:hypothetical protein